MKIRVRAVILKDNQVLLIKRTKLDLIYWVLPGGAVETGETNEEALIREVKEELGIDVLVKDLILEMDSQNPETKGQNEYFYSCEIKGGILGSGNGPEYQKDSPYIGKYNIEWKNIYNLQDIDLKPVDIKDLLISSKCTNIQD